MKYKLKPEAKLRLFKSYCGLRHEVWLALNRGESCELDDADAKRLDDLVIADETKPTKKAKTEGENHGG